MGVVILRLIISEMRTLPAGLTDRKDRLGFDAFQLFERLLVPFFQTDLHVEDVRLELVGLFLDF